MADTKVYLSGGRIQGRSDDETIPTVPQTGWKVLDSYDPQSETATAFTAKDNLIVLAWGKRAGSGSNGVQMRFNGETSSDNTIDDAYELNNGGTYSASANRNNIDLFNTSVEEAFTVVEIRNEANRDKLIHYQANGGSGTGNNVPQFVDGVARYQPATASERITEVNVTPQSSFQAGSKVVVLGCDDDEADSGTDFWTVLKDVDSVTDSTSSGTFAAKDFLRIQISTQGDGTSANAIILGGESNSNTAHVGKAYQNNTTSPYTANGSPAIFVGNADNTNQCYITMWIANISGREKPFFARITENKTLGTDIETTLIVGKFKTTSGQITELRMGEHDGSTYTGNSRITVWGGSA